MTIQLQISVVSHMNLLYGQNNSVYGVDISDLCTLSA